MTELKYACPEVFLEEEIRDGYLVSSDMKRVWAVELDLLAEFIRVCEEYDLRYYADSGTLLGAVRCGGFIPWDDDIDIVMPRCDYDRLLGIAPKEFAYPYFLQTEETDSGSLRMHAQLRNSMTTAILISEKDRFKFNQGIFIDIFVLDAVPDGRFQRLIFGYTLLFFKKSARFLRNCAECPSLSYENEILNAMSIIIKKIMYHLPDNGRYLYHFFYRIFENKRLKYNSKGTVCFANLGTIPNRRRGIVKKKWYKDYIYATFEYMRIRIPKEYKRVLYSHYDNWRFPRNEANLHGTVFFDVENEYTKYI